MARKQQITKIEQTKPQTKVVTFTNGSTLTLYWSKALQQYVTIPA